MDPRPFSQIAAVLLLCYGACLIGPAIGWPLADSSESVESTTASLSDDSAELFNDNSTTNTTKELYVIKAVVYEIGILAEVPDNETLENDEPITQNQVDLTFFSNDDNSTHINLGDIPVPVQTSVNGQVFTGIAPVHVGAVPTNFSDLLSALPIAGTIVNITQTNSSYVEVHRHNISDPSMIVNEAHLSDLPIAGISSGPLADLPLPEPANHQLVPSAVDQTVIGLTNDDQHHHHHHEHKHDADAK